MRHEDIVAANPGKDRFVYYFSDNRGESLYRAESYGTSEERARVKLLDRLARQGRRDVVLYAFRNGCITRLERYVRETRWVEA